MKVRITLTEEALGSAPSNEDLLATYIASKAPTSELSAEEIDNIKAQNAEDRIWVSASALPKAKPCRKAAPLNLRLSALTRNWKIWCVNA